MNAQESKKLKSFLDTYDTFWIFSHLKPDFDALSSQLFLQFFLSSQGKKASVFSHGPFSGRAMKAYAPYFDLTPSPLPPQTKIGVLIVDCSSLDRIGSEYKEEAQKHPFFIIDHHGSSDIQGDQFLIDPTSPSNTLLLYEWMKEWNYSFSGPMAHMLYLGLLTDSGDFQFLEDNAARAFSMAADLSNHGVRPALVSSFLKGAKKKEEKWFLLNLLERAQFLCEGKVALVFESLKDHKDHPELEKPFIFSFLLSIAKVQVVVFVHERKDRYVVSLRSKKLDVGKLTHKLGGGGHERAAGVTLWNKKNDFEPFFKSLSEALGCPLVQIPDLGE